MKGSTKCLLFTSRSGCRCCEPLGYMYSNAGSPWSISAVIFALNSPYPRYLQHAFNVLRHTGTYLACWIRLWEQRTRSRCCMRRSHEVSWWDVSLLRAGVRSFIYFKQNSVRDSRTCEDLDTIHQTLMLMDIYARPDRANTRPSEDMPAAQSLSQCTGIAI